MSGSKENVMKKRLALSLLCISIITFAGCGGQQGGEGAKSEAVQETAAETDRIAASEEEGITDLTETMETSVVQPDASSAQEAVLLKAAPEISLTDVLSSTINEWKITSGNYTWSYMENGEVVSLAACGMHPLEKAEEGERLKIPDYNGLDAVSYSLSCEVLPDSVMVTEWEASQLGDPEAVPVSSTVYSNDSTKQETVGFLIELRPDRVYELYAMWKEERLETEGFSGEAGYVVITQ